MSTSSIYPYLLASALHGLELACVALAGVLTPPSRGRLPGFIGAVTIAEAARQAYPFGGFPLGGIALGQVSGPLAPAARIGGALLITGLTAAAGAALAE